MLEPPQFMPMDDLSGCYYFRFSVKDQPGVLARIAGILGDNNISINSCVQKGRGDKEEPVPIVMLTHEALEADVRRALAEIDQMDVVLDRTMIIRIEELDAL
jgi:homoserine dehydrogenase